MRTNLTRLRAALVLLLVGSGVLFAVGSTIERHQHHSEPASTTTAGSPGETGTSSESGGEGAASETGGKSGSAESAARAEKSHAETGATILGVNTESLALSVTAIVASFLLALLVWLGRWPRLVLLAVAAFGLVFAAGDARGLVHQLDESNGGLAAIAAILIGLHLAVTTLSALLYPRPSNTGRLATAEPIP
jgi:hypothetical protein